MNSRAKYFTLKKGRITRWEDDPRYKQKIKRKKKD